MRLRSKIVNDLQTLRRWWDLAKGSEELKMSLSIYHSYILQFFNIRLDICIEYRSQLVILVLETATGVSYKKVFWKNSQKWQENIRFRASCLIKLKASCLKFFLKKRLRHRYFPVNFTKVLRTLFYRTPSGDCFRREICTWLHLFDCGCDDLIIKKQRIRKSTLLCFIARQSSWKGLYS